MRNRRFLMHWLWMGKTRALGLLLVPYLKVRALDDAIDAWIRAEDTASNSEQKVEIRGQLRRIQRARYARITQYWARFSSFLKSDNLGHDEAFRHGLLPKKSFGISGPLDLDGRIRDEMTRFTPPSKMIPMTRRW